MTLSYRLQSFGTRNSSLANYMYKNLYVTVACILIALFYIAFEGNFQVQDPGGLYSMEGFFCVTSLGGLYLEGLIFGILRYF